MDIYTQIKKAFDFYNQELFNNELPDCIITLSRTTVSVKPSGEKSDFLC